MTSQVTDGGASCWVLTSRHSALTGLSQRWKVERSVARLSTSPLPVVGVSTFIHWLQPHGALGLIPGPAVGVAEGVAAVQVGSWLVHRGKPL